MKTTTTFYAPNTTLPGATIHYGDCEQRGHASGERDLEIRLIDLATFSDYSGTSVERSNYRVLLDDEELSPMLIKLVGSHGTQALAFRATDADAFSETLRGLSDYPVVSDDDVSELEDEMQSEAWPNYGRNDFRKALGELMESKLEVREHHVSIPDDEDAAPMLEWLNGSRTYSSGQIATWGDLLTEIWHAGVDQLSVNGGCGYSIETGGGVYFYVADWKAKAGGDSRWPTNRPIHAWIAELAKLCTVES